MNQAGQIERLTQNRIVQIVSKSFGLFLFR